MHLFDAHCHLQDSRLAASVADVLDRARRAGVAGLCCCGSEEADWEAVARLAAAHPCVAPAYGLHPWYVANRSAGWRDALARRLEADPAAGVGEIGLDHAIDSRNDEEQAAVFAAQLALARDLRRPASIHCRHAWEALLAVLRSTGPLPAGFVVHSYAGSTDLVRALLPFGARFSFSGSLTYPKHLRSRAAAAVVPLERLLIETDAPDIRPLLPDEPATTDPGARRPNEPSLLPHVLRALSEVRGMDEAALAAQLWTNSEELFRPCTVSREPNS